MSFSEKLLQAGLVGLRLFVFCAISLFALAGAAWCFFCAIDPSHSPFAAMQRTLGFIRIPFGVTVGLCIFFAAVSFSSRAQHMGAVEHRNPVRAHIAARRRPPTDKREVS